MRRRRVLQTIGLSGTVGLAGCTSVLDGDESETNGNGNSSETEESEPEYSQVSDYDSSVNAEDTDSYSFSASVERSLDGETTLLDAEITDAYVIRSNENYSDETLEDSGLYNEILDELEQDEEGNYALPTGQLLPGNNLLHLEVQVNDEEHGHQETYTFEEELQVTTTPERALEQTWIEDRDLFQKLRAQHREEVMSTTAQYGDDSELEEGATWMDIANEKIPDYIQEAYVEENDVNFEGADLESRLSILSNAWYRFASFAVDGPPSGQANYLAFALEEREDLETAVLPNEDHFTVLAYDRSEDKTYHVDTAGGSKFPPEDAGWIVDNPETSPLSDVDSVENANRAEFALSWFGKVENFTEKLDNASLSDNYIETGRDRMGEGTDQETMVNTMQYMGLSSVLSPDMNLEISGDIDDPEISVSF